MRRLNKHVVTAERHPTRIIQFGEGNFLRGFLEWQVQAMDRAGLFDGGVAIVQPRAGGHVAELEEQDRLYTVLLEGLRDGHKVRSHEVITVVNQTVDPYADWAGFLALADNPDARVIVSNTTEAGIAIDETDTARTAPPRGYPAKLAWLLRRRHERKLPGFLIIPCELIDDNGPKLEAAVLECARRFGFGDDFARWVQAENTFCSSLVDRIVPGYPRQQTEDLWREFGYEDRQIVKAEPFLLWVIEGPRWVQDVLPLRRAGLDAIITDRLAPYHDRKVFLLNAPHTTMASLARSAGFATVGEVMADPDFRAFIEGEMAEEAIPVLHLPREESAAFARQVEERFENPFVRHELRSIALNSVSKYRARLLPLVHANLDAGRPLPRRVVLALAGLLRVYAGRGGQGVEPIDSAEVLGIFRDALAGADYVGTILADARLWGEDLTEIPGLADAARRDVEGLDREGVMPWVRRLACQKALR